MKIICLISSLKEKLLTTFGQQISRAILEYPHSELCHEATKEENTFLMIY